MLRKIHLKMLDLLLKELPHAKNLFNFIILIQDIWMFD